MITEDYVSFEIAKLLKEKGFDEKCTHYYKNEKYLVDLGYANNIHSCTNSDLVEEFAAPTLQMVMKWLRKVHKIFLNINFIPEHFCFTFRIVHNGVEEKFVVYPSTYEEACEAAIKYCIENLI